MTREFFPDKSAIDAALTQAPAVRRQPSTPARSQEVKGSEMEFAGFDAWTTHREKVARRWLCFTDLYRSR